MTLNQRRFNVVCLLGYHTWCVLIPHGACLSHIAIDERVSAWWYVCGWSYRGLGVGLILLRYAVVCTVDSLYLFYLLFISRFGCTRWYIDKLGIFHANQTSICLDPNQKYGRGEDRQICWISIVISYRLFQGGASWLLVFRVFSVILSCLVLAAMCWSPADLLAIIYVMFSCVL